MEKKFTSDELPLAQMLDEARTGKLQLPDFQRGWVWDDNHITSLLASISVTYPIGAVMTLQAGNPDVKFRPRPLQGVKLLAPVEPEIFLLDGQQRMTSLFLALSSGEPVPTRDQKGKDLLRYYYADIRTCINPLADREDAIISVPAGRVVKAFGGEILLDISTREKEIAAEMFPLGIVLDYVESTNWQLEYLKSGPGESNQRLETWMKFNSAVINAFVQYQVPAIQLVKSTPKEAVCQVFEKVNTGGVSLTVFELLTATYAADDFNLRDDWDMRQTQLSVHRLLDQFEATDFLAVVTLLATYNRRQDYLAAHPGDDKAPAVACKRRDVLRLDLPEYEKWANTAVAALKRVVPFLHGEHIFRGRDLPYATQIVPLAAIFAVLDKHAEGHGVKQKIRQWYWCGVFGEMYGGSTETRFALDLPDVVAWVSSDGPDPRTIKDAQFQADRLLTLRTRISGAYKGLYALQMKRGGRDFRTGSTIDVHAYFDDAIDIHHIFPQKWCSLAGIDDGIANSVVNKTAIDMHTNRRIGGRSPSKYLEQIERLDDVAPDELDAIVASHDIDPVSLRQDDFATFFNLRFERLLKQIEAAMGKPVNRAADRAESPFAAAPIDPEFMRGQIEALVGSGESKVVEFKSTGRKNLHTGDKDAAMEWSVIRSVAGLMNANGGTLVVGVSDKGLVVGIEQDYPFVNKGDVDGWELWLTGAVTVALGKLAASELSVAFCRLEGGTVARIDVGPGPHPIFATPLKGEKREQFLVRINNSTLELTGQEALDYQKKRWPS